MMEVARDHPRVRSVRYICLDVWETNVSAIRLYEKYALHVVDKHSFEVASGADAYSKLIMLRDAGKEAATNEHPPGGHTVKAP